MSNKMQHRKKTKTKLIIMSFEIMTIICITAENILIGNNYYYYNYQIFDKMMNDLIKMFSPSH